LSPSYRLRSMVFGIACHPAVTRWGFAGWGLLMWCVFEDSTNPTSTWMRPGTSASCSRGRRFQLLNDEVPDILIFFRRMTGILHVAYDPRLPGKLLKADRPGG
jgi:hypothetical protein